MILLLSCALPVSDNAVAIHDEMPEREAFEKAIDRRYKADESGLRGSELKPDYFPENLFKPGVPHWITVVKRAREINIRVENPQQVCYRRMMNPDLPSIDEGRIGLKHVFTRSARYRNFRVFSPAK